MKIQNFIWGSFFCLFFVSSCVERAETVVVSPNGQVEIGLETTDNRKLCYYVKYNDSVIIEKSFLNLLLSDSISLGNDVRIVDCLHKDVVEQYRMYAGKCDSVKTSFSESIVSVETETGIKYNVSLRAYDDGVAFRYIVPHQKFLKSYNLLAEHSQFAFHDDVKMWVQKISKFYKNHYEHPYEAMNFDSVPVGMTMQLPLTFESSDYVGAICEAELKDYAGLYLKKDTLSHTHFLSSELSRKSLDDVPVMQKDSLVTPWRVIMLADKAVDLIKSNLVYDLSTPCQISDVSWIKPGRVAWDWWNDQHVVGQSFKKGMNNETMKYFIDFASEMGLEYMLIDAGWYGAADDTIADITKNVPQIDIPKLVAYACNKNVGLLLWVNWINLRNQMADAMKTYASWGIKGIKIDYMDGDLQNIVDFYYQTAKCAADNKLLVDFHGAYKPTGLNRTYPNVMTYEGVLGLEHCKWSRKITPSHNVTIPFTRMLVGPMDYTPGAMDNRTAEDFVASYSSPCTMGTRMHQAAMYVVYESPLQMLSDSPDAYRGESIMDFLKNVPSTWDETVPLAGKIGEYIVLARRNGNTWYIGALNGSEEKREIRIPLSFLHKGKKYKTILYQDAKDVKLYPKNIEINHGIYTNLDSLDLNLGESGGFVAVLADY